jgi:hypothetical protein
MNASIFALTVFLVLLVAGLFHVVHRARFRQVLHEHRVVPTRLTGWVGAAIAGAEVSIGGVGVAATILAEGEVQPFAFAAGALFAAFTAYTAAVLVMRGAAAPCGCARADYPVSVWVVLRAAALALAAIAAAAAPHLSAVAAMPFAEAAIVVTAAVTLSTLAWAFPDALADPLQMPIVRRALVGG